MTKGNNHGTFVLYGDFKTTLDALDDEEAGKVFKAIYHYHETGTIPPLDRHIRLVLLPVVEHMKRNADKYARKLEMLARAGSMGGKQKAANASTTKQMLANARNAKPPLAFLPVNVNVNDNVNDTPHTYTLPKPAKSVGCSGRKKHEYSEEFERFWKKCGRGTKLKAYAEFRKLGKERPETEELIRLHGIYAHYCAEMDRALVDTNRWLRDGYHETQWTHEAQGSVPKIKVPKLKKEIDQSSVSLPLIDRCVFHLERFKKRHDGAGSKEERDEWIENARRLVVGDVASSCSEAFHDLSMKGLPVKGFTDAEKEALRGRAKEIFSKTKKGEEC